MVLTVQIVGRIAAAAILLALGIGAAAAQERRQDQPGKFDFYLLSLSWSPSFCEASGERGRGRNRQCGARPYSFVVHGLWPQYERGFPEFCLVPAPRLDRTIVSSMLDLMPSPRLVYTEWDKHGTCSGLKPRAYFDNVRKARAVVAIPERYRDLTQALTVTPDQIEEAFVAANPGLTRRAIAVTCEGRRLSEVRICLSKDFGFRECPEVTRRTCRREQVVMPPVRRGRAATDIP